MRTSFLYGFLLFAVFTLTRVVLLVHAGPAEVPLALWPGVMAKGLLFDLATAAYLLPFVVILNILLPERLRSRRFPSMLGGFCLGVATFLLLFNAVATLVFWDEFHTLFNFIALDYLIYTTEVLENIWQSYPIVWILGVLAVVSAAISWFLRHRFVPSFRPSPRLRWKLVALAVAVAAPFVSFRFVRADMMYHQGNAFAEEISGNGLFTLAAAARNNELDYDRFYATIPDDKAKAILKNLGVPWTDDAARRADRWGDDRNEPAPPFVLRRPTNVILISVESLSSHFVGAFGSKDGVTPRLDRLANESLIFGNVYATGTRTVRGLEALSLATPPIPGQAIIRRPNNDDLASLGGMLRRQGYASYFFYGGHGYFDNMNAFFRANGYEIRDLGTIPKEHVTFENAWGVCDEDLYDHVIREMDSVAGQKAVFALVMTTSNHRPYTYPDGRIDIPSPGRRKGAVKYTDYAIGRFIDMAKTRPWFKDTLIVIVADHDAAVAGRTKLPVPDYRIPLYFYGPGLIKPGRIDRVISQIDIAPTILDALGAVGDDEMFGQSVHEQRGPARAFISTYESLGYLKNGQLVVLNPRREVEAFSVDPATLESTPTRPDPALVDEAIAYYQTASRAFKTGGLKLLWK